MPSAQDANKKDGPRTGQTTIRSVYDWVFVRTNGPDCNARRGVGFADLVAHMALEEGADALEAGVCVPEAADIDADHGGVGEGLPNACAMRGKKINPEWHGIAKGWCQVGPPPKKVPMMEYRVATALARPEGGREGTYAFLWVESVSQQLIIYDY